MGTSEALCETCFNAQELKAAERDFANALQRVERARKKS